MGLRVRNQSDRRIGVHNESATKSGKRMAGIVLRLLRVLIQDRRMKTFLLKSDQQTSVEREDAE